MANELAALSDELAGAVARAGEAVVAVHARPRFSSSGVFWRPNLVVTAEHGIRREEEITVTLGTGATVPATLAGSDPGTDLALLRVDAPITPLPRAPAPPVPGNLVLAIGRSQDSGVNATMGIVSALSGSWRTWRGGRLDNYIRLDLTVYPTSAGGVVVNVAGEAIGIATPVLSRLAGVAIPASTIDRGVEEILSQGHVSRGYLGVGLQPVELAPNRKGLIVLSVEPGAPAGKAGLLIGDIVVKLDGKPVPDTDDVQTVLESHAPGQTVHAELIRGGAPETLAIVIGERPQRS